jgi:peptide/nickel transport system permease protein
MTAHDPTTAGKLPVPLARRSDEEKVYVASQWQLMWWRFRRHKLALVSLAVIILFYLVALCCEFVAPTDPDKDVVGYKNVPPQVLRFVDANGRFHLRPFVYGLKGERNEETLRMTYTSDMAVIHPIYFFVHGSTYKWWGRWKADVHLFGLGPEAKDEPLYLLGSNQFGRDIFSRVVYGARISLSIGLVGVFVTLILGVLLGGISGYYGGAVDIGIQRVVEFLRSLPTIPLWMALAAALPPKWSPERVYFGITVILSLLAWPEMARIVRGRFLSLREEDFVLAARFAGSSELRIIVRHMVPSFLSHIIASITLSIPAMILSETALSFLGLGLRPPAISWGVLLQDAQNVQAVSLTPWLLVPGLAVVISVLAFNFMGDGLRDAADPYMR